LRGVKPYKVGFLTRPFEWNRSYQLGVSAFLYFPFEPKGTLLTDLEMWEYAGRVLPTGAVLDQGIPKSTSEYVVVGAAHQPNGRPAAVCAVRAEIGDLKKTLFVVGDREWQDEVPTEPTPFVTMPIDYAHAFGGPGYDRNPLGKGYAPIKADGRTTHPLPNVEGPGRLVTSPGEKPEPTSFAPIDFTWPQRFALAGTYDQKWLDTLYPGYAPDMDWRIWNIAPPDQRQQQPFRGDEKLTFKNMHPKKPELTAQLPGIRARAFIQREGGERALEEVGLRLTTVWAFPGDERGILVFQGGISVREDDARDVEGILIAAERLGQTRSLQHYLEAYEKRCDPTRLAETLDETDLVPEDLVGFGPEIDRQLELTTPKGHRATLLKEHGAAETARVRSDLEARGLDPDVHGPKAVPVEEPLPSAAELAKMAAEKQEEAKTLRAEALAKRDAELASMKPLYDEAGLDFAELEREVHQPPGGPPEPWADKSRDEIRAIAEQMKAIGQPVDELEHYLEDPTFYARWKKGDEMALDAYRNGAHLQGPARIEPMRSAIARSIVERALADETSLVERDLTGADLSGLDLRDTDFSRALLENASLAGADLRGATFDGAVLAHADMSGALLDGATFENANLGRAKLVDVVCADEVDLTGAILWGADLTRAKLIGAKLTGTTLMEAIFDQTDLSRSTAFEVMFYKSRLSGAVLSGVQWKQVAFVECEAEGIDLSGGTLTDCTFVKWQGRNAKLGGANMTGARFVTDCVLDGSSLVGATLDRSTLRSVSLRGVDLSGAKLNGSDLSEANLEGAKLYRIVARESFWVRADLRNAQLVSADLFHAILQKADLRGADLRGANLYGADFALIRADDKTNIEDTIRDKVRAKPRRPPERSQ
jgi:uncharacterized protein YjbI with pentapeptide repeats